MMVVIELVEGVLNVFVIVKSLIWLIGIVLGVEDYVINMKICCYLDG